MTAQPWMKFYPRDWRGDQALRVVSLSARGLWIEMICIMHEATPYGHLMVGDQPLAESALARVVGASVEEIQAMLVELSAAGVLRRTRAGVIFSKRMTDDHKRSKEGRKAKVEALEKSGKNRQPSRCPSRPPTTQKPDARAKVEGPTGSSTLSEKTSFLGPKEVWLAFLASKDEAWCRSYIEPCGWQDVPERALIAPNSIALGNIDAALRSMRGNRPAALIGLSVVLKAKAA
ncbi:hypothetical protein [Caulobacter segnis]